MRAALLAAPVAVRAGVGGGPSGHDVQDFQFPAEPDSARGWQRGGLEDGAGDYAIGMAQLVDDTNKDCKPDPKDLDVKVKVGWVKGLNGCTSYTRLTTATEISRGWDCITTSSRWWWTTICRADR
jgi:hypothetical protein